jgi:hypothetical protein
MKSSIRSSYLICSKTSLSSAIVANPLSLSCVIVERKYDFTNLSLEKLLSADATVTGTVNKI